ncbi:hypothetical protein KJ951_00375 [Patescibacteria group bacterium]|nr:hypothetical protein [Patescibacteria group bacterium]
MTVQHQDSRDENANNPESIAGKDQRARGKEKQKHGEIISISGEIGGEIERTLNRPARIAAEDRKLAKSPTQRRMILLDYIRRGRLIENIEIMGELIDMVPGMMAAGLIDFITEDYNPEATQVDLVKKLQEFEAEMDEEDKQIRYFLGRYNLTPKSNKYLNEEWYYENVMNVLKTLQKPKSQKNPQTEDQYKTSLRNKASSGLKRELNGNNEDINHMMDAFEQEQDAFQQQFSHSGKEDAIKSYLRSNIQKNGLSRIPKLSEYAGETVDSPPSLMSRKVRENLYYIERNTAPDFGGVMLDGNFGFDKEGNAVRPDNIIIIDHHDQFDTKKHDNATRMVIEFIKDPGQVAHLDNPALHDEQGRLRIMTNNLDSDSILSTWVMFNRDKPQVEELKNILRNITNCGDFMLGSKIMEFGANARDYEYIIRNYLQACKKQIKQEKAALVEEEINAVADEIPDRKKELEKVVSQIEAQKRDNPEIAAKEAEIQRVMKDNSLQGKEKGMAIKAARSELNDLMQRIIGPTMERQKELGDSIKALEEKNTKLKKKVDSTLKEPTTKEEEKIILDHMLDIVEDIIRNPFKYKKFLLAERQMEEDSIRKIDENYRNGSVEIEPDTQDPNILHLKPLGGKILPDLGSIDGQYFFFRRREDFNRELIVTQSGRFFMMAINTQNVKGLMKYDFNLLVDRIRDMENEKIQEEIEAKEAEMAATEDKKKREEIEKQLEVLRRDLERNKQGELWRNRTQMIFSLKTRIPEDELMEAIYEWKITNNE